MKEIEEILYGKNVLNLKPAFRLRHPWVWWMGCAAIAVIAFVGLRSIMTRAETQDFYPTTCLGDWQNPASAQGQPETLTVGTPFTSANSAMDNASATQIFCGGFLPPGVPTSSNITNVGLTLVWQIGDVATTTGEAAPIVVNTASIAATSTVPTSTATVATSSDDSEVVATTSDATTTVAPPVIAPTPDNSSDDTTTQTSFLRLMMPIAFADDNASDAMATTTVSSTPPIAPPRLRQRPTTTFYK